MSPALLPDDAPLPEGWIDTFLDGRNHYRMIGPVRAIVDLAHRGRPRGPWRAAAVCYDATKGFSLSTCAGHEVADTDYPTRTAAMRAAEKAATQMATWIVCRAKEIAGEGWPGA